MENLLKRLNHEMLFFDGAMGTQLQKEGLKAGQIPEELNVDNPQLITRIHENYLNAGADFITTNTFGCNRIKMKKAKYSVEEMLLSAVENARKARENCKREKDAYVVLDIGPIGTMLKPLGTLTFDEAYEIIAEEINCVKDKVDAVLFETMSDLYEIKAGILAVKENSNLPVFVTMTFEKNKRSLTGVDTETFVNVVENLGADAIGVNCSLGPDELTPIIEDILSYSHIPVMAQPNAGLPNFVHGETVYELKPDEFCKALLPMAKNGLAIIGGCCGTSPEFISMLKATMPTNVTPRENPVFCKVSSSTKTVTFKGQVVVCGERLNPTGKKKMQAALREGRFEELVKEGIREEEAGAHVLDVNVGLPGIDEAETMKTVIPLLQEVIDIPLQIDSSLAKALETACRYYNGRPLINSVNGKEEVLNKILPIVKKYGGVVIGLTLEEQIPLLAEDRIKVAKKIINRAEEYGIRREDVIIDCLCLTASAQQKEVSETLKAVSAIREMGNQTVLGVSNVSFGLPNRPLINRTFLTMALWSGLTMTIINPLDEGMMSCIDAYNVLANKDQGSLHYIERHGNDVVPKPGQKLVLMDVDGTVNGQKPGANSMEEKADNGRKQADNTQLGLFEMILHGMKDMASAETKIMLKSMEALTLINEIIIPALNQVGEDYESGKIFLPQLIQSAEATKAAFEVVRETFPLGESKKGPVLICTVEGDIHDIGKNIVKVVMESYGYEMIDLGKDVKVGEVVEAYKKYSPKAIGLSALMTTTVVNMKKTIEALHEEGCKVPIWVGGAVLTDQIAKEIGADYYTKDAMDSVHLMDELI